MQAIILDAREIASLIERRRETGADRYDEVWDGVYVMAPLATNEHQRLATKLSHVLLEVAPAGAIVLAGANVSDRTEAWEHEYRCPDVVVVLPGGLARDAGTHWVGGPDLVVEVVSPNDRSRDKLGFYASLGVREVLLLERDSKGLELFQLRDGRLVSVGISSANAPQELHLDALELVLSSVTGSRVIVTHAASGRSWEL